MAVNCYLTLCPMLSSVNGIVQPWDGAIVCQLGKHAGLLKREALHIQ